MKDYKAIAESVLNNVGGSGNISRAYYCTTRLRLELKDWDKADVDAINSIKGVVSVKELQGQMQVIIGPDVNKVYDALVALAPDVERAGEVAPDSDDAAGRNESLFTKVTRFIAGIFIPIVPCLAGAGIIQAVLSFLSWMGVIDATSDAYTVLNIMQNAVFYFLPFLVAVGAAKQFKTNEFYAVVMAGVIMHPTIAAAIAEGVTEWHLLGMPLLLSDCSSTVVPIVLSVAVLSYVERFFEKVIPAALRMMLASGLTFIVTGLITLFLFAPFGTVVGNALSAFINWALGISAVLGGALLGGLHLIMVMTGTHFIEVPLIVQEMATGEGTSIMPITAMGVTSLVGALAALIIKTKDSEKKGDYLAILAPTVMGISEPVLYGVAVVLRTPLLWSVIGGAAGGIVVAVSGFKLTILGVPGVFAGLVCLGMENGIWLLVGEIVAIAVGFIGTWIFCKVDGEKVAA